MVWDIDALCSYELTVPNRELFTGAETEGEMCWEVASTDADSLVMFLEADSSLDDRRAWFALR